MRPAVKQTEWLLAVGVHDDRLTNILHEHVLFLKLGKSKYCLSGQNNRFFRYESFSFFSSFFNICFNQGLNSISTKISKDNLRFIACFSIWIIFFKKVNPVWQFRALFFILFCSYSVLDMLDLYLSLSNNNISAMPEK